MRNVLANRLLILRVKGKLHTLTYIHRRTTAMHQGIPSFHWKVLMFYFRLFSPSMVFMVLQVCCLLLSHYYKTISSHIFFTLQVFSEWCVAWNTGTLEVKTTLIIILRYYIPPLWIEMFTSSAKLMVDKILSTPL